MLEKTYKSRVEEIEWIADQVLKIRLKLIEPNEIFFRAGQFLMVIVPSGEEEIVKRAYSIASPPSQREEILFVVKLRQGGKASEYFRSLKVGDGVVLEGPHGLCCGQEAKEEILFVGTGTGVAPLRAMIMENLANGVKARLGLFFGVRSVEDIFWREEFENLAKAHENFSFTLTLSRPDETWAGPRGRVTDHIRELDLEWGKIQAYVCGSIPMVREVVDILLEKGVTEARIRKEMY